MGVLKKKHGKRMNPIKFSLTCLLELRGHRPKRTSVPSLPSLPSLLLRYGPYATVTDCPFCAHTGQQLVYLKPCTWPT